MPSCRVLKHVSIERTTRVMQLEGMFDIPPTERSESSFDVSLPFEDRDWSIGLIVGPSGSGKTTIARELFPEAIAWTPTWHERRALVDSFPDKMTMREITQLLSSVGFSSPPAWLRPFGALSNGEQFRANVARTLAENPTLSVIDEFTSVVDRVVAKIGSAAVAKAVRGTNRRLIACSCHYDVVDWLQPDWIFDTLNMRFQWRELQRRPAVAVELVRVSTEAWVVFRHHHYLSATLNRSARCFMALVDGRPAAFTAVLPFPHSRRSGYREHRTVSLPDFQGIGLGNAVSEYVGSLFRALGKPYFSTTSHPAMIRHRAKSPLWVMTSAMNYNAPVGRTSSSTMNAPAIPAGPADFRAGSPARIGYRTRPTASFEYVGPARHDDAHRFGLL